MKLVDAVLDKYSTLLHILGLPSALLDGNENGSFHFHLLNHSPKYFLIDIRIDIDFPTGPSKGWPAVVWSPVDHSFSESGRGSVFSIYRHRCWNDCNMWSAALSATE